MTDKQRARGVLFLCTANICRSPMAEAIFTHLIHERQLTDKWFTDSAGIGDWFAGRKPDPRALNVLSKHGIASNHRARQVRREDFDRFDYILCMDIWQMEDIDDVRPQQCKAVVQLLGSYDPEGCTVIQDPYFESGDKAYHTVYDQCWRACKAFLDKVN